MTAGLPWQRSIRATAGLAASLALVPLIGRLYVLSRAWGRVVFDPVRVDATVGAVLGAGVRSDGRPSGMLARRIEAAAGLFEVGSVDRLIMSGASNRGGDQPGVMARLATELGVPEDRILLDRTGVDTAATCRMLARHHPGQQTVLITQQFHAARTAYLATKAGLDAVVYASPDAELKRAVRLKARGREVVASVKAIFIDRFEG